MCSPINVNATGGVHVLLHIADDWNRGVIQQIQSFEHARMDPPSFIAAQQCQLSSSRLEVPRDNRVCFMHAGLLLCQAGIV